MPSARLFFLLIVISSRLVSSLASALHDTVQGDSLTLKEESLEGMKMETADVGVKGSSGRKLLRSTASQAEVSRAEGNHLQQWVDGFHSHVQRLHSHAKGAVMTGLEKYRPGIGSSIKRGKVVIGHRTVGQQGKRSGRGGGGEEPDVVPDAAADAAGAADA